MSEASAEASESVDAAGCGCGGMAAMEGQGDGEISPVLADKPIAAVSPSGLGESAGLGTPAVTPSMPSVPAAVVSQPSIKQLSNQPLSQTPSMSNSVTASQAPSDLVDSQLVYALGTLGYDFGSEARRDSFKQLMPTYAFGEITVPANPYDARQLVDYLAASPSEAKSLIWTLNIELTPVYAIEPQGAYARDVYAVLQEFLAGQIQAESSEEYVERISVPGTLTGRTVNKVYPFV